MSIDTKILEHRLITKDSVRGSASISRSAEKLAVIGSSDSTDRHVLESFIREMVMFRMETDKSCRTYESYEKQVSEYNELQQTVVTRTDNTTKDIENLRIKLHQENEIRRHRLTCEGYAEDVNKHKSGSYLKRNIMQIEENILETKKKLESTDQDIKTRKSQFDSLLTALLDLESQIIQTIDEENDSDGEGYDERGAQRREEDPETEVGVAVTENGGLDNTDEGDPMEADD